MQNSISVCKMDTCLSITGEAAKITAYVIIIAILLHTIKQFLNNTNNNYEY